MKPQKPILKESLHPSNKVLADFIDNRLSTKEHKKIVDHLVYCDECCDIVASTIKYIKKKC